jgi:hypothetical protein
LRGGRAQLTLATWRAVKSHVPSKKTKIFYTATGPLMLATVNVVIKHRIPICIRSVSPQTLHRSIAPRMSMSAAAPKHNCPDLEASRTSLLEAAARGRHPPPAVVIVRPSKRPSPPLPSEFNELHVEDLELLSDDSSQGWVPLLLARLPLSSQAQTVVEERDGGGERGTPARLPVVLLLHCTGSDRGSLALKQAEFARRGYLTASIDCRYHGLRAVPGSIARDGYQDALIA